MSEFLRDGRARSMGPSNFQVPHLERLAAEADVVPAVNQIEVHPYLTNEAVRAYGKAHGMATEAWSPMAKGQVLDNPTVTGIAAKVGRTPAQVLLDVEHGNIVFPKSASPERMQIWACSTSRSTPPIAPHSARSTGATMATPTAPDTFEGKPKG